VHHQLKRVASSDSIVIAVSFTVKSDGKRASVTRIIIRESQSDAIVKDIRIFSRRSHHRNTAPYFSTG
jgi:hypothetical protein